MDILLIAAIIIVGALVLLVRSKGQGGSREYPYQRSKYLLSKAERSFYGVLVQAVSDTGIVFSKVRVADVISPKKGLNRSDWQRAFNAISSKHFDFIVCDPADCSIKLAVELDDSSHGSSKAKKRDDFLNGACRSSGVPILRIKAAKSYAIADLKRQLEDLLSPQLAVSQGLSPETSEDAVSQVLSDLSESTSANAEFPHRNEEGADLVVAQEAKSDTKVCPKCGEAMILRKAKSGANAGKEFWGCSRFPKCRTVLAVGA